MKPDNIILVRHGESEGNANRATYAKVPDHKIVLTHKGCGQAIKAGKKIAEFLEKYYNPTISDACSQLSLTPEHIERLRGQLISIRWYISPHARSRQTFEHLNKAFPGDNTPYEDPRLREQDWGHYRDPEENEKLRVARDEYGTFYYRCPNGESGADVYDRISTFLDTMHRDFEEDDFPRNVIIVSHGLTMRLFIMRWFHCSVEEFESWIKPDNCEFYVMKLNPMTEKYVKPVIRTDEPPK